MAVFSRAISEREERDFLPFKTVVDADGNNNGKIYIKSRVYSIVLFFKLYFCFT